MGTLIPNEILDERYRILEPLGKGGTATVYLAEHLQLKMKWAIKAIEKEVAQTIYGHAQHEAHVLKNLLHPGLPRVIDIFEDERAFYIVRDYIEGETLEAYVDARGPFDHPAFRNVIRQVIKTLSYLHQQEKPLIYRDLKPANIIISAEMKVVLVDFGTTRHYNIHSDMDTVYLGTKGYAAPEQFGGAQTDARTDIYALGALMYFMLTGEHCHLMTDDQKWQPFKGEFLSGMQNIIDKCMTYSMEGRYRDVLLVEEAILKLEKKELLDTDRPPEIPMKIATTQVIGVMGLKSGAGVTTVCFALAVSLRKQGHRVCYVEYIPRGSLNQWVVFFEGDQLNQVNPGKIHKKDGIVFCELEGVSQYLKLLSQGFDYLIVDYGASQHLSGEFLRANIKWLIMPSKAYSYNGLAPVLQNYKCYEGLTYVFNLCSASEGKAMGQWLDLKNRKTVCIENLPRISSHLQVDEIVKKNILDGLQIGLMPKKSWLKRGRAIEKNH